MKLSINLLAIQYPTAVLPKLDIVRSTPVFPQFVVATLVRSGKSFYNCDFHYFFGGN